MSATIKITADELTALCAGDNPSLSEVMQRQLIYTPEPGLDHGTIAGSASAEAAVRKALATLRSTSPE